MTATRKPHFLEWNGEKELALFDGMSEMNRTAIATEEYGMLCLFKGDWPDLTYFADVASKVTRLTVSNVGVVDLKSIELLTNLEYLTLFDFEPLAPNEVLDFSVFKKLQVCTILEWRPTFSNNLLCVPTLTDLAIGKFPAKDLGIFAGAPALQSLALDGGALTSLAGIAELPLLRQLSLTNLRELAGIEVLFALKQFKVARFFELENFTLTEDALLRMAEDAGRELKVSIVGCGAGKSTVTLELL